MRWEAKEALEDYSGWKRQLWEMNNLKCLKGKVNHYSIKKRSAWRNWRTLRPEDLGFPWLCVTFRWSNFDMADKHIIIFFHGTYYAQVLFFFIICKGSWHLWRFKMKFLFVSFPQFWIELKHYYWGIIHWLIDRKSKIMTVNRKYVKEVSKDELSRLLPKYLPSASSWSASFACLYAKSSVIVTTDSRTGPYLWHSQ